ncbi:hypothetical protein PI124_g3268 [Phytophthora idaei]|nr:hypothetical protein PI125_g13451 [Phytophthora idaei]KAG3153505.1 hypothetical protein PI126_g10059 [Phytophthora idaei]KAG3252161.1 hypothetical protein PI124_g3268 [Phytophthora idaei]
MLLGHLCEPAYERFGKLSIPYLSHEISAEGLRAIPKIAKGVVDLPFLTTLKGVQSFLGSLNYYYKFIEDLPLVASALYELTEDQLREGGDLGRAKEAFEILEKIVSTPLLRHPDRTKDFVVIFHANPWAACAVLGQEHDRIILPVRYTGKTLNDSELMYHCRKGSSSFATSVTGVLHLNLRKSYQGLYSLLRLTMDLHLFVVGGRCLRSATMLTPWDLEVHRIEKDEDSLAAIMGAGIAPREHLDQVAEL